MRVRGGVRVRCGEGEGLGKGLRLGVGKGWRSGLGEGLRLGLGEVRVRGRERFRERLGLGRG